MKKKIISILMLVIFSLSQGKNRVLDAEETVKLFYKNSFTLKNEYLNLKDTKLKVKESYKELFPKLNYVGEYKKNEKNIYGGSSNRSNSYTHKIELVQPLYRGGLIQSGIDTASKKEEQANYRYQNKKNELRIYILEKYIKIIKLSKQLDVYNVSLKEIERELERAEKKYELNLISKAKLLPFKTKNINTRSKIIYIKNQLEIAKLNLKNDLNISEDIKIEVLPIDQVKYNLSIIDVDEDVKFAKESNKESQIARLNYEITRSKENQAKSNFLPKIDLRGGYETEEGSLNRSTENGQWDIGVSVKMNLFSFGQDMNKYQRSKNETQRAKNLEIDTKDKIELKVRTKFLNLVKLEGVIAEQKSAVKSANENYNIEKNRAESGLIDVIDFLAIEKALRNAELELIQSELNYYLAYERYQKSLK